MAESTIPYEQVIAPFLDWIANANPQITAQSELATAQEFGDQWNTNEEAQLWFNVHRRQLVQDILGTSHEGPIGTTESLEGDDDASTQSGPQAPDEGEEEDQEEEEEVEEIIQDGEEVDYGESSPT